MNKAFFILAAMVLLFSSCDGITKREWTITNNATATIYVEVDSNFWPNPIDPILAGETKTLFSITTNRSESTSGSAVDDINFLIFNSSDSLIKDANNEDNWLITTEKTKKYPARYTHQFIFDLNDSDF